MPRTLAAPRRTAIETDEHAFLAKILATPEDDAPRGVFADWLDEHGRSDEAGLIRAQLAAARFIPGTPEWTQAIDRARELAARSPWLARPMAGGVHKVFLVRGMPEAAFLTPDALAGGGANLFARHPHLRFAHLRGLWEQPRGWLQTAVGLSRLTGLSLSTTENWCGPASTAVSDAEEAWGAGRAIARKVRDLFRCPHLGDLRVLDLSGQPLGDGGLKALARSEHLGSLTHLYAHHPPYGSRKVTDAGVADLHESPLAERLQVLDLCEHEVGPDGLARLLDQNRFKDLQAVGVAGNPVYMEDQPLPPPPARGPLPLRVLALGRALSDGVPARTGRQLDHRPTDSPCPVRPRRTTGHRPTGGRPSWPPWPPRPTPPPSPGGPGSGRRPRPRRP